MYINNYNEDEVKISEVIDPDTLALPTGLPSQNQALSTAEYNYNGNWNTIATEKYGYTIPGCSSDVDLDLLPEVWFTTDVNGGMPDIGSQCILKSLEYNDTTSLFSNVMYNNTFSTTTYAFPFDSFNNGSVDFILKTRNSYPTLDDNYLARWENDDLVIKSDLFNSYSLYDYVSFDFDVDSICDFSMVFEYYANGWQHGEIAKDGSVSSTETSFTKTGSGIFVSDVDGDNEVELVVSSYGGTVTVYDYSGGTFTNTFSVGGAGPANIYAWDYDLNGIPNIMIIREISGELTLNSYEYNPTTTNYELSSDSLTITNHPIGGLYISDAEDIFGDGNQELVIRSELASNNYELGYVTYNNSAFEYHTLYTNTFLAKLGHQSVQIDDDPELEFIVSYENTSDSNRVWNKILDYQSSSETFSYYEQNFDSDVFGGGDILDWDRTDSSITTDTVNGYLKIDSTDGLGDWANVTIPQKTKIIETRARLVSGGLDYKYPDFGLYTATGTKLVNARVLYDSPSSWGWAFDGILNDFRCPFAENVWWDLKFVIGENNVSLFAKSAHSVRWDLISTTDYTGEVSYLQIRQDWDALLNVDFLKIWYEDSIIDTDGDGLSDDYEISIGTDPNDPDSDKDKFNDGEEDSAGTDPLDRYDNINITSPILWHEPFNSEIIWDDANWHRTGTYYAIDETNEWLHKGTAGGTDDHVWYDISFTLPVQITFRGRETGSSDAGTAGMELYLENGTDYGFMGTVYDDWRFFQDWYLDLGYTHIENEWYTVRCNISSNNQELWVKSDLESEWTSLLNTTLKINSDISGIGFYASLDDHLDIDYVTVARLSLIDTDGDGLSDDYETLIGTDPNEPDTDKDKYLDGDEVSSGTDPLDRYNNSYIVSPITWYEPFNSETIWDDSNWSRSNDFYSVDEANEWLLKTTSGSNDDYAFYTKTLTYPFEIEIRGRLVSGGNGYTTPTISITLVNGTNLDIVGGNGATQGDWKLFSQWFFGIYGPVGENEWWSIKAIIDSDHQELYVKSDSDTGWYSIGNTSQILDNNVVSFGIQAPWDSTLNVDYLKISDATDQIDSDSDGLKDVYEISIGTNPNNNDTDTDGLSDGEEVNIYYTDPLVIDTDTDTISDFEEVHSGTDGYITDPNSADTDTDGLTDDYEIDTSHTDPTDGDTDGDTIGDYDEIYTYFTDPTSADTDSDGLDDYEELVAGVDTHITDPNDADSDDDGLDDGDEYAESTDPNDDDSDNDTLLDGEEVLGIYSPTNNGANATGYVHTNPLLADSDGDLYTDNIEIDEDTDPNNGSDYPVSLPPDTDLDGLNDEIEAALGTNPNNNDTDGDGLFDGEEVLGIYLPSHPYSNATGYITTNPLSSDSDGDTLSDYFEIFTSTTNPNSNDSDEDGMPDNWELSNSLDPLLDDSSADPDSDNLSNLGEYDNNTDPQNSDTDSDGMDDGWETDYGLNPLINDSSADEDDDNLTNKEEYDLGTDPTSSDTDSDGMPDDWEVTNALDPLLHDASDDPDGDGLTNSLEYLYGTNPRNADTDEDGYTDKEEVDLGFDPTDSSDNPGVNANPTSLPLGVILGIIGGFIGAIIIAVLLVFAIRKSNKKELKESRIIQKPLSVSPERSKHRISDIALASTELATERQEIFRNIIRRYSKIHLSRMTNLLKFRNIVETENWLLSLPSDLRFYLEGSEVIIPQAELLSESSTAQDALDKIDQSFTDIKANTCYYCGLPLSPSHKKCDDCGKEVLRCAVCKLPISFGDEIGQCSLCEVVGHLTHLQEWVKTQGKCPTCLQNLPIEGIVPITPEVKKPKKEESEDNNEYR